MNTKINFTALLIAVSAIGSVSAQTDGGRQIARLTDSNAMLTTADPSTAKFAECQPLRGEAVSILQTVQNSGGMRGLDVAKVQVLEGRCKGNIGYVGLARLEAAH